MSLLFARPAWPSRGVTALCQGSKADQSEPALSSTSLADSQVSLISGTLMLWHVLLPACLHYRQYRTCIIQIACLCRQAGGLNRYRKEGGQGRGGGHL